MTTLRLGKLELESPQGWTERSTMVLALPEEPVSASLFGGKRLESSNTNISIGWEVPKGDLKEDMEERLLFFAKTFKGFKLHQSATVEESAEPTRVRAEYQVSGAQALHQILVLADYGDRRLACALTSTPSRIDSHREEFAAVLASLRQSEG